MLHRSAMTPKPAKCPHCRQRLAKLGDKIHPDCVGPWYEANREKLRAKVAQRIKRMAQEARKQERVRDRAAREAGKSIRTLMPLCPDHHRGPLGVHGLGTKGFPKHYGFDQTDLLADALALLEKTP